MWPSLSEESLLPGIAIRRCFWNCKQALLLELQTGVAFGIAIRRCFRNCNQALLSELQSGVAFGIAIRRCFRNCNQVLLSELEAGVAFGSTSFSHHHHRHHLNNGVKTPIVQVRTQQRSKITITLFRSPIFEPVLNRLIERQDKRNSAHYQS